MNSSTSTSHNLSIVPEMDQLRKGVREILVKNPGQLPMPQDTDRFAPTVWECELDTVWQDVSSQDHSTHLNICESLVAVVVFIDSWDNLLPNDGGPRPLNQVEARAVTNLFGWASAVALPSSEFAIEYEAPPGIMDIIQAQKESQFRSELAMNLVLVLNKTLPSLSTRLPDNVADVILAGACFDNEANPWVTSDSHQSASFLMGVWIQYLEDDKRLWPVIESILKERIRPLFANTRNPAITSAGRKNFHPQTLPRFGSSDFQDSEKPWKTTEVYVVSVLKWILSKYTPKDKLAFEAHFPLFVPTILAMIDDNNLHFKTEGCLLLTRLLQPIQQNGSDILRRTNLTSVFEEAVTPCLLSIPTITPEDKSLQLLGAAYPALLNVLKTAYKGKSKSEQDQQAYTTSLANILRSNLISSFHHVSSSTPASESTSASFPYPRLSTFLLDQMAIFTNELGVQATKYLQELVPVLYTTLSNTFSTAHPPLLRAATAAMQAVIKNAHPRIWRWRGEILSGLTSCWLHISADENKDSKPQLAKLKGELQQATKLLKHVLQNPVPITSDGLEPDQLQAKEDVQTELQELIEADAELKGLLS